MNIIYADYNIYHNSIDICTVSTLTIQGEGFDAYFSQAERMLFSALLHQSKKEIISLQDNLLSFVLVFLQNLATEFWQKGKSEWLSCLSKTCIYFY